MSTPLFLLLGLTIATCVIAYWADNLGKKLGKKRVTLFGLRPRQTATLITMISSVGIMFFTLATLLLVNSGLRRALLHYDEERAANTRLRADNKQLRDEQGALEAQNLQAREATAQAQKQTAIAQKAASAANRELKHTAETLKYEQANLKAAKAQERLARLGESSANLRAKNAAQSLTAKQQQLNKVNLDLTGAKTRLGQLNTQLKNANSAAAKAHQAALKAQEGARKAKSAEKSAKKVYLDATTNYLDETRRQLEKAASLQGQIDGLETRIADLNKEKSDLELAKDQLRTLAFDAQLGEVFAARTIAPRLSASNVATQMRGLIEEGERVIKVNNPNRTLRLVLPDDSARLTTDEIIEALLRYLTTFNGPVSVRLTSTRNHAASETEIHAALMPVSARMVFSRNEVITSMTIEAKQSDARVFNQLLKLLNRGEAVARDRGVSPLLKGDELFYSADTNERIFETLRRIQVANASVTVRVIADTDISAIDQLRVRFEIVTPEL